MLFQTFRTKTRASLTSLIEPYCTFFLLNASKKFFQGSPPFSTTCKRASIQTLRTFYMKYGTRDVGRRTVKRHRDHQN